MRCLDCGHNNPNDSSRCQVCRAYLPSTQDMPVSTGDRDGIVWNAPLDSSARAAVPLLSAPPENQQLFPPDHVPSAYGNALHTARSASTSGNGADVTGRVIAVEAPVLERPDFDLCRALAKTLTLLLLLISPLLFLHSVLTVLGGLSALLALVGLILLLRFFSPANLFMMYHLLLLVNPLARPGDAGQVPVRYVRVRGEDEQSEYVVRMKGVLTLGNLMPDDIVSFWGSWRRGVLHARYGYSHRTQAWIAFQRSYSWLALAVAVCVFLLLAGYFYGPVTQLFSSVQELGGHP